MIEHPRRQTRVRSSADFLFRRSALAVVLLASACRPDAEQVGSGVLQAREVRRLELDALPGSESIVDVTWSYPSAVLVSLAGGSELVRLDWSSRASAIISRKGGGPGESTRALWLLRRSDSAIVSVDATLQRMNRWDVQGALRTTRGLQTSSIIGAWVTNRGLVLKAATGAASITFSLMDDSGVVRDQRVFAADRQAGAVSCDYCPAAVSDLGVIAMAVSDTSYRILRADSTGGALAPIERPGVPAVIRTRAELDSIAAVWNPISAMLAADPRLAKAAVARFDAAAKDQKYKRRFLPRGLLFDETDRLWVQRTVVADDSASVDVFSDAPAFLGTVRLPAGSVVRQVRHGRLLATIETNDGGVAVVEFEVMLPE